MSNQRRTPTSDPAQGAAPDASVDIDPLAATQVAGTASPRDGEPALSRDGEPAASPEPTLSDAETLVRPRSPDAGAAPGEARAERGATRVEPRRETRGPSAPASGIEPGSVLFGEYEVIEVLGAGGMGEVYRARHRRLDEFRAIKMMHADLASRRGASELFLREAKALLAVRHPAVVHCHDLLSDESGRVFLIMEMIEGESLGARLAGGPLPADQVVLLGARLAAGLQAAHERGVVHRDVSPDNVVLPGGKVEQAKLIDFGIAKILEAGQGTIVDGFKGKLGYASPEQLGFFGGRIDGRSDFYSLGLVLCAAALGRPLGMGTTVVEAVDARRSFERVPDEIPVGLRSAIEPLLALDPKHRPQHPERLFLAPGAHQPGLEALRAELAQRERAAGGGRAVPWRALAAVAAVVLALAGYWLVRTPDAALAPAGEAGAATDAADGGAPSATTAELDGLRPAATTAGAATQPAGESAKLAEPAAPAAATTTAAAPPRPSARERRVGALERVRIVGLLRGAESALAENRLQSPPGDNAYEKYRDVLELDPENQPARRGLVAVAGRYLELAEAASRQADTAKARDYLARAAAIAPHHPELDRVRGELDARAAR